MSELAHKFRGGIIALEDEPATRSSILDRGVTVVITVALVAAVVISLTAGLVQIDVSVDAAGELEPLQVWTVRAPQGGSIASVAVRTGDILAPAQPLFVIDSLPHAAAVQELRANMEQAAIERARSRALRPLDIDAAAERVELAAASMLSARAHLRGALVDNSFNPNGDSALRVVGDGGHVVIDIARADVLRAEREFRLAQLAHDRLVADSLDEAKNAVVIRRSASALAIARTRLKHSLVRSPARGIVLTERVEQMAGRAMAEGEAVLEIGSLEGWRAHVLVSESDVHRLRRGQQAEVKFSATDRERRAPAHGRVVEVGAQPWNAAPLTTGAGPAISNVQPRYRVVIEMDSTNRPADAYRRGFTVRSRIHVGRVSALRAALHRIFGAELTS